MGIPIDCERCIAFYGMETGHESLLIGRELLLICTQTGQAGDCPMLKPFKPGNRTKTTLTAAKDLLGHPIEPTLKYHAKYPPPSLVFEDWDHPVRESYRVMNPEDWVPAAFTGERDWANW
jgi:hypothetical protein